eukprot:6196349-Pleurochrysis_carterae.AAC.1
MTSGCEDARSAQARAAKPGNCVVSLMIVAYAHLCHKDWLASPMSCSPTDKVGELPSGSGVRPQ